MSEEKAETNTPETKEEQPQEQEQPAASEAAAAEPSATEAEPKAEEKENTENKENEDAAEKEQPQEEEEESEHLLLDKEVDFDRPEGYVFKEEENVYVIDPNGFDIWEAQISKIVADNYAVHYPEYPQDDEELHGTARLLAATEKNKDIYKRMENNRQKNIELKEKQKNQRRGKKQKKNKKKKEQGIRHNPLRGPTIVKKKY
ncbi:hypothetical protein M9Y10_037424 [Tritrichomonas musculus]|uniref:Uncharacterized protein n=1 Tax=Tritrichomonas musculus TaxID=1915356 RepID=A0ABR2GTD5_9EUKA